MRKIVVVFFLLLTLAGFGQNDQVYSNEKIVGKNLVDGSSIKGIEYVFPNRIHETFLDTTTGFLTAQLRGVSRNGKYLNNTGTIIQYDLKNKEVLWGRNIAYQTSSLQQFSKTMIYTVGDKSYCLDIYTGENRWKVKNNIYFVDPEFNIGIGYKFKNSYGYSNELEGIDLSTGNVIWTRELNRALGWNDVFYTHPSTLIVVAAGLHEINLKTGIGWDYNTISAKEDYTGTVAANAIGVAVGLLTGTFAMSTGHDLVRDLVSNTIIDKYNIYFSSKEQLVKLDKETGEIIWRFSFSGDIASKSSIFMNDSLIFMINKGMAYMGNRQVNFGKPFFAAFYRESGNPKFFSLMDKKNDPILDYEIKNKTIFLAYKNRIAIHSMETGNLILEKQFSKDESGEIRYFIGNQVYIQHSNGDFMSLLQSDSSRVFAYTTKGNIVPIDNKLTISETIDTEDVSIYYLRTKEYKFFEKDNKTLIVNNVGERVAEIDVTSNAFLIGNTLYDTQDKSYIEIDLGKLINN